MQNKLQQAMPLLPTEVQQQGVIVAKAGTQLPAGRRRSIDTSGRYNDVDIADFIVSQACRTRCRRVTGVGNTQVFGAPVRHAHLARSVQAATTYRLTPSRRPQRGPAQNVQVSAGQIGGLPSVQGQALNATVTAQSRLQTPEQFRNIILQDPAGRRRWCGWAMWPGWSWAPTTTAIVSAINGHPAAGIAIKLAPGANALKTVEAVKSARPSLRPSFPPGMKLAYPVDTTAFIRLSIQRRGDHPGRGHRAGGRW